MSHDLVCFVDELAFDIGANGYTVVLRQLGRAEKKVWPGVRKMRCV